MCLVLCRYNKLANNFCIYLWPMLLIQVNKLTKGHLLMGSNCVAFYCDDSYDSGIFAVLYMQIWDGSGLSRFVHPVRHAEHIYYLD